MAGNRLPNYRIGGGLCLLIDLRATRQEQSQLLRYALDGGVDIVQIYNAGSAGGAVAERIHDICTITLDYGVPVLVNDAWELLQDFPLAGVHFEVVPDDFQKIKRTVSRRFLTGVTCGNDLSVVEWAIANAIDYISFCSIFPSRTANTCEFVDREVIRRARTLTNIPIFVAGGITPENLPSLLPLGINGAAVVGGLSRADDPKQVAQQYKRILNNTL